MKTKEKMITALVFLVTVLSFLGVSVRAEPTAVEEIERGESERKTFSPAVAVQAQAGNVTSLDINASRITTRWQGYFGNITGEIVLGDAGNNTFYSWSDATPQGEIYAVNSSIVPTWTDVYCFNFSNNKSEGSPIVQKFNGSDVENALGMGPTDVDGVDETFNQSFTGSFDIGSNTINSDDGCSMVTLNVNSQYQETDFQEVLLTDNESLIFTAILENSQTGFQGAPTDFQMLVGENGDVAGPTNYYFYVELS